MALYLYNPPSTAQSSGGGANFNANGVYTGSSYDWRSWHNRCGCGVPGECPASYITSWVIYPSISINVRATGYLTVQFYYTHGSSEADLGTYRGQYNLTLTATQSSQGQWTTSAIPLEVPASFWEAGHTMLIRIVGGSLNITNPNPNRTYSINGLVSIGAVFNNFPTYTSNSSYLSGADLNRLYCFVHKGYPTSNFAGTIIKRTHLSSIETELSRYGGTMDAWPGGWSQYPGGADKPLADQWNYIVGKLHSTIDLYHPFHGGWGYTLNKLI